MSTGGGREYASRQRTTGGGGAPQQRRNHTDFKRPLFARNKKDPDDGGIAQEFVRCVLVLCEIDDPPKIKIFPKQNLADSLRQEQEDCTCLNT